MGFLHFDPLDYHTSDAMRDGFLLAVARWQAWRDLGGAFLVRQAEIHPNNGHPYLTIDVECTECGLRIEAGHVLTGKSQMPEQAFFYSLLAQAAGKGCKYAAENVRGPSCEELEAAISLALLGISFPYRSPV